MNEKNLTELISQVEATNESWSRFKHNRERDWGLFGHDMGIHDLNLNLGGWVPKKVTTIAGRSGHGKTALVTPMFKGGARILNGRRAEFLFFSWEMGASYVVDRHICNEAGITLRMLNQGAKLLDGGVLERLRGYFNEARRLPVTYQQMSLNIETLKSIGYKFVEECEKKSVIEGIDVQPVIVIDYVGMAQFQSAGLRTYGIGDFMNAFKQFCNVTNAAGLVFAQINRTADEKTVPDKSDLSDSQAIEMASDNLIIIHRPEYNNDQFVFDPRQEKEISSKNKMLCRVVKSREYGTADFVLENDMKYFRFHHLDHTPDYKYWELYSDRQFWLDHFGLNKGNLEQLKIA